MGVDWSLWGFREWGDKVCGGGILDILYNLIPKYIKLIILTLNNS